MPLLPPGLSSTGHDGTGIIGEQPGLLIILTIPGKILDNVVYLIGSSGLSITAGIIVTTSHTAGDTLQSVAT